MPKIVLKNVTKRFGKFVAVDNLNLVIDDRSFITLLGPSGCGKTTTLRMIAGLETPTEGEITINDRIVFSSEKGIDIAASKRDVGFLFQNYALWPHMTVTKNISFGLENLKWPKDKIQARVDELLKMLRIEEFKDRYPAELSGGQQQRVAIARTLATGPKVLFMDEPLSNLDAKLRMEMRTELKRLHHDTDSTFVYVTHDQLEAMTLSTKICLMKNGVLQQYANPLEVYRNPANTFTADFVGSPNINLLNFTLKDMTLKNSDGLTLKIAMCDNSKVNDQDVILGLRPEYVQISNEGSVKGEIYSSLPSGMETTLRLKVKDYVFSSVLFGSLDFKVGEKLPLSLPGETIVLFDSNGNYSGEGSLEIL